MGNIFSILYEFYDRYLFKLFEFEASQNLIATSFHHINDDSLFELPNWKTNLYDCQKIMYNKNTISQINFYALQ